jgi:hypothetical protein
MSSLFSKKLFYLFFKNLLTSQEVCDIIIIPKGREVKPMEDFRKQFERFEMVLWAKENYSMNCGKCPLEKECEEANKGKTLEEIENGPTCEEVLLRYILTGEVPE